VRRGVGLPAGAEEGGLLRLKADLQSEALRLGLQGFGVGSPHPSTHEAVYREWLRRGFHGEMHYLARPDAVARRGNLTLTMEPVEAVVVVAQGYFQEDPLGIPQDRARGVVARYARGEDYHHVLRARLLDLLAWLRQEASGRGLADDVRGFAYVDTGPILERELAQRAGLGWFGRNTLLLHPRKGSYFFLGALLVDLALPPDEPFENDHCGSCRACLESCPTGALLGRNEAGAPVMDARRCISYLTIEAKGPVPRDLRPLMGNRIFGCDICQEVCPWNGKFAEPSREPAYAAGPDTDGPRLMELLTLTQEEFSSRFIGSPIKRAKRSGFLRNVAVALGNWMAYVDETPEEAVGVLCAALEDEEPLVRGHAAWALGQVPSGEARRALSARLSKETDGFVRAEIEMVLGSATPRNHDT